MISSLLIWMDMFVQNCITHIWINVSLAQRNDIFEETYPHKRITLGTFKAPS